MIGNNIDGSPHSLNVTECQELCKNTDGCLSFDYPLNNQHCYLNNADSSMVELSTCNSRYWEPKGKLNSPDFVIAIRMSKLS